mmetsp:Transcript_16081/g.38406  ORF Transcript_16081/g.38406 Transcript_16081/m.38406 type:complete len:154 (-) Transcript_16081:421-882(-)
MSMQVVSRHAFVAIQVCGLQVDISGDGTASSNPPARKLRGRLMASRHTADGLAPRLLQSNGTEPVDGEGERDGKDPVPQVSSLYRFASLYVHSCMIKWALQTFAGIAMKRYVKTDAHFYQPGDASSWVWACALASAVPLWPSFSLSVSPMNGG